MIRIAAFGKRLIQRGTVILQYGKVLSRFSSVTEQEQHGLKGKSSLEYSKMGKVNIRSQLMANNTKNLPSSHRDVTAMENISNQGISIDFAIFINESEPSFIRQYIQESAIAKAIKYYNPHLTNGGDTYDQFPLIKLISIALRKIEEDNIEPSSWKQLEFFIRKRLHRCTIQENLKLLYIMLKVFPKYTFDYGFIMSICIALKKEISIMSTEELKMLFYVLYTNRNEPKRYNNSVIANIQTIILTRVLEKCDKKLAIQQQSKHVHLPIQYLYSWITLGLVLSVRNNYLDLVFEERVIEIINHFNQRWQAAVLKEQQNKIVHQQQIAIVLYLVCILDKLIRFYEGQLRTVDKDKKKEKTRISFKEEFGSFKMNIIAHTSKKISKLVQKSPPLQSIRTFRVLLELYPFQLVENLLQIPQTQEQTLLNEGKYNKIMHFFSTLMKYQDYNKEILTQKLILLNNLYNRGLIAFATFKTYYLSINLKPIANECTLQLAHQLIRLELYLFTEEEQFNSHPQTSQIIVSFLQNHMKVYRHFDWHAFHFLNCLITKEKTAKNAAIASNLPINTFTENTTIFQAEQVLGKIVQDVRFYNTQKLVRQEISALTHKKEINKIQKFFIQIRVNEMKELQPVIAPFNRLPHFSNSKEKIAVNSLTKEELQMAQHRLEKKLMNLAGWRVVNLNCDSFIELSLNERLRMMAERLEEEGKDVNIVKMLMGKEDLMLGDK